VKKRFQSLPFKCNLQRYTAAAEADGDGGEKAAWEAQMAGLLLL
jgi:hypothetical protein